MNFYHSLVPKFLAAHYLAAAAKLLDQVSEAVVQIRNLCFLPLHSLDNSLRVQEGLHGG